jgi:tetratricopeptide (TPR) repeat protein
MNDRTEQLIELYFANALSEAERLELKTLLSADPTAAAEFAWQQQLAQQVTKLPLSKSIQNEAWREAAKPPFRQASMIRTVLAAAAAIALLVVAYLYIPSLSGDAAEGLVAESFEHFPNKMKFKNLGAVEENVSPEVLEAFAAYDLKKYDLAATKLTAVVKANPDRLDYRYYLGVASVGAKKYQPAIDVLLAVAQDTSSAYNTPACYFLGLAYAGVKDVPLAKKYLQACIAAEDGVPYREQAEKLLEGLK